MTKRPRSETLFSVGEEAGVRFLEGAPGRQLLQSVDDASLIVEACGSNDVDKVLLYAENLTGRFFDLSSREAGEILGKLRTYWVRLAVVCPAGSVHFSRRFGEMAAEEKRSGYFCLFESAPAARAWLSATRDAGEARFGAR